MRDVLPVRLERMRDTDFAAVIDVWRAAKRDVYTFIELEQGLTRDDDERFFRSSIAPRCEVWMALGGHAVVGFLAMEGSYIDRLYVDPLRKREGVGSVLLDQARRCSPCGLELHTHQRNTGACAFYEAQGFRAVHYGISPPPESEPDVEYHWRPGAGAAERAVAGR